MQPGTSAEYTLTIGGGPAVGQSSTALYAFIVCAIDGARFAAVASSEQEGLAQIASYVAEEAGRQLWPQSAQRVYELLASGDLPTAIAEYFRHSGERWDREWLMTTSLDPHSRSTAWSGTPLSWMVRG